MTRPNGNHADKPPADDRSLRAVSFLIAENEQLPPDQQLTEEEIGVRLFGEPGQQSRVNRLKGKAMEAGYLIPRRWNEEKITAQEAEEFRQMNEKLKAPQYTSFPGVAEVRVFKSGEPGRVAIDARLGRFSKSMARSLASLLVRASVAGVAWGKSISECQSAIVSAGRRSRSRPASIRFVPVCGHPVGAKPSDDRSLSASHLAERFEELFNDGASNCPSLIGVESLLAGESVKQAWEAFLRRHRGHGHYDADFGDDGYVRRLDTLLVSIGPFDLDHRHAYSGMLAYTTPQYTREQLADVILGDIAGALIPKPGMANRPVFQDRASRCTGISPDAIKRIVSDATKQHRPGVIVAAIGANKAEVLHEVLRQGMANRLLIDDDLDRALRNLVNAGRPG